MPSFFTTKLAAWVILGLIALLAIEEFRLGYVRLDLAAEQLAHEQCKTDRNTAMGNEAALTNGINAANARIKVLQAEEKKKEAKAAADAQKALEAGKRAYTGHGPEVMNQWMHEVFR